MGRLKLPKYKDKIQGIILLVLTTKAISKLSLKTGEINL